MVDKEEITFVDANLLNEASRRAALERILRANICESEVKAKGKKSCTTIRGVLRPGIC